MSERVQELYISLFGRPADPAGLAYWAAAAEANGEAAAFGALAASPEFQDEFDELTAAAVVEQVYEEAFGREPEPEGLAYWTGVAGENPTPEQLANLPLQIIDTVPADTPDGQTLANKVTVANAVTASLAAQAGPDADLSGLNPVTLDTAGELLDQVTADPASVETAQARVDQIASDILAANDVPVVPDPGNPDPGTPNPEPTTLNVDAAQATDAEASVFQTIQEAVDAATAGSTINIAAGTYTENLQLKSDLTLAGTDGVIVRSAEGEVGVNAEGTQNVRIHDVAFTQATALDSHFAAENSTALELENVAFAGDASVDDDTDGVVIDGADLAKLTSVSVTGYGGDGVVIGAEEGESSQEVLLTNVSAINNGGAGIVAGGDGDVTQLGFDQQTRLEGNETGIRLGDDDDNGLLTGTGENGEIVLNDVAFVNSLSGNDVENNARVIVDASLKTSDAPVAQTGSDASLWPPSLGEDTITPVKGAATTIANFNADVDEIALPWFTADPNTIAVSNFDPTALPADNQLFANAQQPDNPYDVVIATGLPGSAPGGEAATWLIIDADANQAYGDGDQIIAVDVVGGSLTTDNLVPGAVV